MNKNKLIGLAVLILILINVVSFVKIITEPNKKVEDVEPTRYSLLDMQLELKYWSVKSELIDSVQSYIDKIAPSSNLSAIVLVNECSEANVSIPFALAQGQKESHYGTRGLGAKTNSVFNVYAYDGLTFEEINELGVFKHPNLSVKPYLEQLNRTYLVNKTEEDLMKLFVDINKKRYASYDKYEVELRMIYDSICKKTKIKSLEEKFIKLKTQRDY
ncbi:MAG: hypothetical protein ACRCS6_07015 [Turicibacter sp.]